MNISLSLQHLVMQVYMLIVVAMVIVYNWKMFPRWLAFSHRISVLVYPVLTLAIGVYIYPSLNHYSPVAVVMFCLMGFAVVFWWFDQVLATVQHMQRYRKFQSQA